MLIHTNRLALVQRLQVLDWMQRLSTRRENIRVYFNSIQEESIGGIDNRGDFKLARVMTNRWALFHPGDMLLIDGKEWKVDSGEIHEDMTGGHESYLVTCPVWG